MTRFYLQTLLFIVFPLYLMSVDIAITIDDYPMADGRLFSSRERTKAFLKACSKHKCQAAFFCIGQNCKKAGGKKLLAQLNNSGHFLANHSMSHTHFSGQSLEEFKAEIKEAEAILAPYRNMRKWFRYPFLDYGNRSNLGGSDEKASSSIELLQQLEYTEGFVTINTFDWYIDGQLSKSLEQGKSVDYKLLKVLYLDLLKEWCNYYIKFYETEFPEKITHTLLLHANDLNALYLQDILSMLKESGWSVVSPEKAFASTSWRDKIHKHTGLTIGKPPTMDSQEIDRLLEIKKCFRSSS